MTLQPLLHDLVATVHTPWQAWASASGDITSQGAQGIYYADTRAISNLSITVNGQTPELLAGSFGNTGVADFTSLCRNCDGTGADPRVVLSHVRAVTSAGVTETLTLQNARSVAVPVTLAVRLASDLASMDQIKQGREAEHTCPHPPEDDRVSTLIFTNDQLAISISSDSGSVAVDGNFAVFSWDLVIPAKSSVTVSLSISARSARTIVESAQVTDFGTNLHIQSADIRVSKFAQQSIQDLAGLLMRHLDVSDGYFLAAGAPWFFTLFGRDSLIAARLLLPLGTDLAYGTLKTLAHFQGTKVDPNTAEQPGKILHEVRAQDLDLGENDIHLPPIYYGTVDATPLWVMLLHEAWTWGLSLDKVKELLPNLDRAMDWLENYADPDGDGFLEYHDPDRRGLANQGWKDSGDSIQWSDGTLAEGPIALVEVQGYAHKAALAAADIYEAMGDARSEKWTLWAANLKAKFAQQYWVEHNGLRYPAIALDAHKKPVNSLTSNIGHLLGTGILTLEEETHIANLLVSPAMSSGYGLRTMSTQDAGYWPLSYHGGSVWTHDTALTIKGMAQTGHFEQAAILSQGLLRTAADFEYRVPELHAGYCTKESTRALPYPAACRPQAWSAASSIAILTATLGLTPRAHLGEDLEVTTSNPALGAMTVSGIRHGAKIHTVSISPLGTLTKDVTNE